MNARTRTFTVKYARSHTYARTEIIILDHNKREEYKMERWVDRLSKSVCEVVDEEILEQLTPENFVESNPAIRGGETVIRGTRIPIQCVVDMLNQGASEDEILSGYPTLTSKDFELAQIYGRTHPKQESPAKRPWHDRI